MFIDAATHTFPVPGQPGEVTVRRLIRKQLRKAVQARAAASIETVMNLGGPKAVLQIQELDEARAKRAAEEQDDAKSLDAPVDLMAAYDEDTVLRLGVVGFSKEALAAFGSIAPVEELVERLDETSASFIANEIIAFTKGLRNDPVQEKND